MRMSQNLQTIKQLVDIGRFTRMSKIVYISLEEDSTILDFIDQIRLQVYEANFFEQKSQKIKKVQDQEIRQKRQDFTLQFLSLMIRNVEQLYRKSGIDIALVIDEAQNYYSMVNILMKAYKDNKKTLAQKLTAKITSISYILKLIKKCFPRISFLTSEKLAQNSLQKLSEFKEWEEDTLFRFEAPMKAIKCDLQPDFRLDSLYFQMQMYLILWFGLIRKFRKEGDAFTPEQEQQLFQKYMLSSQFFFPDWEYANCEV